MFRSLSILLVSIALCIVDSATIPYPGDENLTPLPKTRSDPALYRLPGETTPSNYVVVLKVDPNQQDSFWGTVKIDVTANRADNRIVLHANAKSITSISVTNGNGTEIYSSHNVTGQDTYFLSIGLIEPLVVGEGYTLNIEYFGNYGRNLHGLYLSSYQDDGGNRKYLATTQFEPVNARDAFPCYDEPGLKAVFQINIYVPPEYHAISNTDLTNITNLPPVEDGLDLYAFFPTVKMSSYLIAFVISDFKYKSNLDEGQQQFYHKMYRVFARPNAVQLVDYAVSYGQKSLGALENFTDVEYALSKMDNFAIPDFSAGAMENWGLITYREQYLFNEPGVTTTRSLQSMSTVISHENAHMWFGNEISPAWWDYLWLSEGFATYFEHYATDQATPEWRMMEQFVSGCIHRAMPFDATTSTNPMTSSVASPSEINNNFNTIAYQKSGSVIRMMEHILGTRNFQQGLRNYLKTNSKGAGEPRLLFEGLQQAIENTTILPPGITVSDIFGQWSTTAGFPVVYARKSVGDRSVTLKQERYYQDRSISNDGEKWWIPISWANSHEHDFANTGVQSWFHPESNEHVIDMNLRDGAWYILNKQATGYFRTLYDDSNWHYLGEALRSENFSDIHILNRVQLIDDSLEFARTLRMSYNGTFDILNYLQDEVDYIPWLAANPGILFLNTMMPGAENYHLYKEFVRRIVRKGYENVGFESNQNDTGYTKMNRMILLETACTAGINDCREKASNVLESWLANNNTAYDPDLRSIVYCGGMRNASRDLWNSYWNKYMTSSSDSEKLTILRNLACSENDQILKSFLSTAVSVESQLSESHRSNIVEYTITSSSRGVDNAIDSVVFDFSLMKQTMPSRTVGIINTLRSRVVTESNAVRFMEFADTFGNFTTNEKNAVDAAVVVIKQNREWLDDVLYDVDRWLIENVQ